MMGEAFAAVAGALALTKQLLEMASVVKDAKAKQAVADLQIQLAELKGKVAELVEENVQLKQEVKQAKSVVPEVVLKEGQYFKPDGDGPFCTVCFDRDNKLIRPTEQTGPFKAISKYHCSVCKTSSGPAGRGR